MIYLKEPNTNRIVEFASEASIGAGFRNWAKLTESEILAYELQKAKESKKQALKANRDNALNNSIYSININGEGCNFYLRNSDLSAIKARIDGLSNDTSTSSWGCTSGRRVELNKTAFQSLYRHINVNDETVYNLYAEKVEEINNATNLEDLNNININFN